MVRAGARDLEEGGGRDRSAESMIDTDKSGGLGQSNSLRRDTAGGEAVTAPSEEAARRPLGRWPMRKGPL